MGRDAAQQLAESLPIPNVEMGQKIQMVLGYVAGQNVGFPAEVSAQIDKTLAQDVKPSLYRVIPQMTDVSSFKRFTADLELQLKDDIIRSSVNTDEVEELEAQKNIILNIL
jgi:hypothetical protein